MEEGPLYTDSSKYLCNWMPPSANAIGPENLAALPAAFPRDRGEQRTDIKGPVVASRNPLIRSEAASHKLIT